MVSATVLDHQIPCLGFSIKEDYHINIDKAKLSDLNLPVGPWLGKLKEAIRHNSLGESISIEGREFVFADIKDIAHITTGQKISYICDLLGSEENILKAVKLAKGSDVLYIEAYFLDKDKDRARERYHLTAKQAGRIAREAGVARLEVFHFSPKYTDAPEELIKEAEREFRAV
ncbi:MAG: hypothetical protein HY758_01545 [Nitrospirae bacterium]|nr:hypothetical protein [Nitrospirota bacterium]